MSLSIVKLFRPVHRQQDWTNIELAEFYRIEGSLIRIGISVETDRGLSDEGHPWFVFCRADTGDVILHLARLDGYYLAVSPAFGASARGPDFKSLIQSVIGTHLKSAVTVKDTNVYTHPSAALIALVSICYFKMQSKDAVAAGFHPINKAISHAKVRFAGESSAEARAAQVADGHDATELSALIGLALSQLAGGSGANAVAAPATHLFAPVAESIPLPSLHPADVTNWIDQRPHLLNDLVYVAPTRANALAPLPAVDLAAPLTHLPSAAPPIQFNSGAEQPHDSSSAFQALTQHVSFDKPLISVPQSSTIVAPDLAASTIPPSELILTTSIAGREVISVLGDSLQTHFDATLSEADKGVILNGLAKHTSSAISPDLSSATSPSPAPSTPPQPSSVSQAAPEAKSGGASSSAEIAAATKLITQFESAHPDYAVIDSGKEVVIYDTHLTTSNYSSAVQESFSFTDGSSIYLVGLPTLNHEGALVS
jgi:hypothetical protein